MNKLTTQIIQRIVLMSVILFATTCLHSQTVIKMKRQNGVSLIPCKINGLDLELIFDTGASDVSISLIEAETMLKNGTLTKNDIIGLSNYQYANGQISEGIEINIKEIEIAGLKMKNVKASIVKTQEAPLLLGQTAISKLGTIQLDLNSNTITILNGKGDYDYSTNTQPHRLDKYYQELSTVIVEKKDNNEGVSFSYTIPKKWKEQTVINSTTFRRYKSDEYPDGVFYELRLGLQTLPYIFSNNDSCRNFVNRINIQYKNIDSAFQEVSISNTEISTCRTIKNITLTKIGEKNKLNIQYYIFFGNKLLNVVYSAYSTNFEQIVSISEELDRFCDSQSKNIVVHNVLENVTNCTIQSTATENKKGISIILNKSCIWQKAETSKNELLLTNRATASILTIGIGTKNEALQDFNELSSSELTELKNIFIENINIPDEILSSEVVRYNKKSFIHLITKSNRENNFTLIEYYYYVINKRLIAISSILKDKSETELNRRFQNTQNDVTQLLNNIEITSQKSEDPNEYFEKGISYAESDNYKDAIKNFTLAIELKPTFFEAYYNRGIVKSRLHSYYEAITDYNSAIDINDKFTEAYYSRGIAKAKIKNYNDALNDFNRTIELNSTFADAYLNRGIMKIILGRKESGCDDLKKAKVLGVANADKAINLYCN